MILARGAKPALTALAALTTFAAAPAGAQTLIEAGERCLLEIEAILADSVEGGDPADYLVAEYCEAFPDAVAASRWAEALPADEAGWLSAAGLASLIELERAVARRTETRPTLAADQLDAAIERLRPFEPEPAMSLWERLVKWIVDWLESDQVQSSGLIEWLRSLSLPEGTARIIVVGTSAVIVLLAIAIALNEIRRARAPRRRSASAAGGHASLHDVTDVPLSFERIKSLPLRQQPGALFVHVVAGLHERRRVEVRDDQTHREVIQSVRKGETTATDRFESVATAAERAVFGGWTPEPEELASLWRNARALLDDSTATGQRA